MAIGFIKLLVFICCFFTPVWMDHDHKHKHDHDHKHDHRHKHDHDHDHDHIHRRPDFPDNFRPRIPELVNKLDDRLKGIEDRLSELEKKIDALPKNFNKADVMPMDCEDVRKQSQEATIDSGLFLVQVPGLLKRRVYCEFLEEETWMTISTRSNGEENFDRNWVEYKNGFGKANGEYWIGNEMLHKLTAAGNYSLRISMNGRYTSSYKSFKIGNEVSLYHLQLGAYDSENSNGGDGFFPKAACNKDGNKDAAFSTFDYGNAKNCSETLSGGWWFTDCGCSNLNGKYSFVNEPQKAPANKGIYWDSLPFSPFGYRFSLKKVTMEIRRI